MDYTNRLDDKEPQGCDGNCQACPDYPFCMILTPIEIHGPQCEEVYYDPRDSIG